MIKRIFSRGQKSSDFSIVVIDDSPNILKMITMILEKEGYQVFAYESAVMALAELDHRGVPHLLIVDLMMPDMNGREFLEKARIRLGRSALPPVLMLTAASDGEDVANRIGVEDFMPKPFSADALLNHTWKLIERAM